jgi:hypothetical protein
MRNAADDLDFAVRRQAHPVDARQLEIVVNVDRGSAYGTGNREPFFVGRRDIGNRVLDVTVGD